VRTPYLDLLHTPANGQILLLAKPLSKRAVELAFRAASAKATGRPIARIIRDKKQTQDGEDFWASFVCFPIEQAVHFLPKTNLKEKTYGFLLLLEVEVEGDWFLGIFKHQSGSISNWLENKATLLPRRTLTNAFSDGTTVSRLSLQRMTVSKHELRGASYEAADLKTSLPMMAASRCAVRSIRFNDDVWGSVSVSINTSRVQHSGGRCEVEDLAELVIAVAEETLEEKENSFLDTFAQAVPLSELPADAEPNSILFDWTLLLETDELELHKRADDGTVGRQVKKRLLSRVVSDILPLIDNDPLWQFASDPNKPLGAVRATTNKYSIATILGERLVVQNTHNGEVVSLAKWTRDNDSYSITFTQPEYFYGNGALYHRADFSKEIESVRNCLQPENALVDATSEKGKPKKQDGAFPPDSLFRISEESIYGQRDWLCCADLGDEWADYLCIRNNALLFIHCKAGEETTGASSFQEVIGQGLKNLGRIRSTPLEFQSKLNKTAKRQFWSGTKINRLRDAGRNWTDFQAAVLAVLRDPNSTREVHLVVTMLSLAGFNAAAANVPPAPHFIQLVWLLASFIDSCREMGAKPVIVCKP